VFVVGVQGIKLATNYDKLGKLSVPLTALKAIGTACTGASTLGERCRPQSVFIWGTAILAHRGIRPPASPDERAFGALPAGFSFGEGDAFASLTHSLSVWGGTAWLVNGHKHLLVQQVYSLKGSAGTRTARGLH
jgi:hypothetical protein